MEEFRKDDTPVWRHRNVEHRPDDHQRYVQILLDRLSDLEAKTRPSRGSKTEAGKDLAAFQALQCAAKLVEALAGWAIDHQIGLALEGREFVPLQPSKTKKHPEYVEARQQVDSHRHEREGGAVLAGVAQQRISAAIVRRRALENLLAPSLFPFSQELRDGLQSLDFGRPTRIMQPEVTKAHHGPVELECQMKALAYIEYQVRSSQKKKHAAQSEVATAFCVSVDAVRKWERQLREKLGGLAVSRRLAIAENAASYGSERHADYDQYYLAAAAADYRAATRS